ncbi:hypothetical protein HMPREF9306_00694 [Propionimicrobium lymphophilum ACS-093-V-SCH5]|uniref:Major facilitator superfamily (MFS) profile domain-containing protein n=1 Tax=Propionimicrobium lymphophilum ACS-093-V-SCH5 TaxID=883161 RepID=S2W092_9ACTN|nr:MFS transporter [Propionimicrobium lymphophilum]EPD33163.1 hypothetical protein HMPREF9306_00694 [Propionimicrobium lymphophilum ACS-093-V-SCH5]
MREKVAIPRDAWILTIISFLVALGFGVVVPVLPIYARDFGASATQVGAIVSFFAIMRLLMGPFCGIINSKIGERTALGIGMLIVGASSFGCGMAQSYLQLLLFRGAGGIGSALFSTAGLSQLFAATTRQNRGRSTALFQSGSLIGNMSGPAVGAIFVAISLRAPFFFYASTLLIGAFVAIFALQAPSRFGRGPTTGSLGEVWKDKRYQIACLASFSTGWQAFGVRSTLLPILIVEILGQPTTTTGIVFAIAAAFQMLVINPVGRAVDQAGRKPILIAGLIICGLVSLSFPQMPNVVWLTIAMCVFSIGASMLGTAPASIVGDVAGRGTPVAVFQMSSDLGNIIGPLAAGAMVDLFNMQAAIAVGSVIMLLVAVLATRIPHVSQEN